MIDWLIDWLFTDHWIDQIYVEVEARSKKETQNEKDEHELILQLLTDKQLKVDKKIESNKIGLRLAIREQGINGKISKIDNRKTVKLLG